MHVTIGATGCVLFILVAQFLFAKDLDTNLKLRNLVDYSLKTYQTKKKKWINYCGSNVEVKFEV